MWEQEFAFLFLCYELICHNKEKRGICISIFACEVVSYDIIPLAKDCFYSYFSFEG